MTEMISPTSSMIFKGGIVLTTTSYPLCLEIVISYQMGDATGMYDPGTRDATHTHLHYEELAQKENNTSISSLL